MKSNLFSRILCPEDVANFCSNLLFLFGGFDRAQMNNTLLQEVVKVSYVNPLTYSYTLFANTFQENSSRCIY